ncbi:MAG: hypothetical protein ACLQPD_30145 [Desulfomonilaceae bacterium]
MEAVRTLAVRTLAVRTLAVRTSVVRTSVVRTSAEDTLRVHNRMAGDILVEEEAREYPA